MLDPNVISRQVLGAGHRASAALAPARPAMLSVAAEVPAARVTTAELAERLGVSEDWIVSRTGIRERPVAAADERLSDFAARAGLGRAEPRRRSTRPMSIWCWWRRSRRTS